MSEQYQFPYGFSSFIEENSLPMPPIPLSCISMLEEGRINSFASDARRVVVPTNALSLVYIDEYIADNEDFLMKSTLQKDDEIIENMHFCALGLGGHGIQNNFFYYIEERSNYKLILRMPWANAYTENESEKPKLEKAFELIKLVQITPFDGYRLTLILDNSSCEWALIKRADNTVLNKGTSFKELLELLNSDEIIEVKGHEYANWMPV